MPGVLNIEVLVSVDRPAGRIIHVRDWHYVPRELYASDLRAAAGRPVSEAEIDTLSRELWLQVELVQREQMTILRCLACWPMRRLPGLKLAAGTLEYQENFNLRGLKALPVTF